MSQSLGRRILVTGGMGFIGTAVVRRLAKTDRVTVVDRLDFGRSPQVDALIAEGRVELVVADLADPGPIHDRIAKGEFDGIIHLAALTHIPLCEAYPDIAYRSNVVASLNIISRVPDGCRLINISTSSTYAPEDHRHGEDSSALAPIDFYGLTKKHVEELAAYYAKLNNVGMINVRLANAAGYGETNPKLIGTILTQIHSGASVVELGNLTPRRDFIHVDDLAWVFDRLMQVWPVPRGTVEIFNIATGHDAVSVEELFWKIAKAIGRPVELRSVSDRKRTRDREMLYPDPAKLKRTLPDYAPKHIDEWLPDVARNPGLRVVSDLEERVARLYRAS